MGGLSGASGWAWYVPTRSSLDFGNCLVQIAGKGPGLPSTWVPWGASIPHQNLYRGQSPSIYHLVEIRKGVGSSLGAQHEGDCWNINLQNTPEQNCAWTSYQKPSPTPSGALGPGCTSCNVPPPMEGETKGAHVTVEGMRSSQCSDILMSDPSYPKVNFTCGIYSVVPGQFVLINTRTNMLTS